MEERLRRGGHEQGMADASARIRLRKVSTENGSTGSIFYPDFGFDYCHCDYAWVLHSGTWDLGPFSSMELWQRPCPWFWAAILSMNICYDVQQREEAAAKAQTPDGVHPNFLVSGS